MSVPARRQAVANTTSAPAPAPRRIDLAALLEPHLAPGKQAREWAIFVEKVPHLWPMNVDDLGALTPRQLENCRAKALSRNKRLPSLDELFEWEGRFDLAVRQGADEPTIRLFIGLMFDGFPGRANEISSAVRLDALTLMLLDIDSDLHDATYGVKRYSSAVLAWAVRRALRTQSFAPSAHEFLQICHNVRNSFVTARVATARMVDLRCDAERFLILTGDIQFGSDGLNDDIPF